MPDYRADTFNREFAEKLEEVADQIKQQVKDWKEYEASGALLTPITLRLKNAKGLLARVDKVLGDLEDKLGRVGRGTYEHRESRVPVQDEKPPARTAPKSSKKIPAKHGK